MPNGIHGVIRSSFHRIPVNMVSTNTVSMGSMGSTVSMVNPNIPYRPNIPVDMLGLKLIPLPDIRDITLHSEDSELIFGFYRRLSSQSPPLLPATKAMGAFPSWTRLSRYRGSPRMNNEAENVSPSLSLEFSDFSTTK